MDTAPQDDDLDVDLVDGTFTPIADERRGASSARDRLTRFARQLREFFDPPVADDSLVTEARQFRLAYEPIAGDAAWLIEYSKWTIGASEAAFEQLDAKADAVIRYLGGGAGLVTIGVVAGMSSLHASVLLAVIPSFASAMLGVWFASRSRRPRPYPSPGMVNYAYKMAMKYGDAAQQRVYIANMYKRHCQLIAVNHRKAALLHRAWSCYQFAILLLALPLAAAIFTACFGNAIL